MTNQSPPHQADKLDRIWFTRCPVPTATGLAYKLGWLSEEFTPDGVAVDTLQESSAELRRHHYDHDLPTLIREGGNMLAIGARGQDADTRLIGLTWIEEWQRILVRPDSPIREAKDLKGARLAVPTYADHAIVSHQRGSSISRGMSLAGYRGALASAGLTFDDVTLVEVESGRSRAAGPVDGSATQPGLSRLWPFQALLDGKVDAIYVKGASAVDAARAAGVVVGVDLDRLPDPRFRVNNGTPRPITVHRSLIDDHFDVLARFLHQTLRAADWARENRDEVHRILQQETRGTEAAVTEAYGDNFHRTLHPDLSAERLALFERQKHFLWLHGFLDRNFDLQDWIDDRPLAAAHALLNGRNAAAA